VKPHIVVVEDERNIAHGIEFNLEAEGYQVELYERGEPALERLQDRARPVDLVVLDVMLPGLSGFEVLSRLRETDARTTVLLLTARDSEGDIVEGLDRGADDYLTKPFSLPVLLARVRTLLRRSARVRDEAGSEAFRVGAATVTPERFELERDGQTVPLTAKEQRLLCFLHERRGRAVSRGEILEEVWELHPDTQTRVVDTFVLRLRKLIEADPARPRHLTSVRGFGYRLEP
jgi:DNA-binding response OmpR family regulator